MGETRVIASINQKGGVGKTTTTANLGYALAQTGNKVLLIDFDPQTSLSAYLNVIGDTDFNIYSLMCKVLNDAEYMPELIENYTLDELIDRCIISPTYKTIVAGKNEQGKKVGIPTNVPFSENLFLIPGSLDLADYELYLIGSSFERSSILFQFTALINRIRELKDYDYILIDGGPSLGILNLNAIAASTTGIIIPTNLDVMSTRGVKNLIDAIGDIQLAVMQRSEGTVSHYGVIGVVLNLYRLGRTVDTIIQNDLERYYPFKVFKSTIPESINAKKAVLGGVLYSQIYAKARDAYEKLASEMIRQIEDAEKEGPVIKTLGEDTVYTLDDILNGGYDDGGEE